MQTTGTSNILRNTDIASLRATALRPTTTSRPGTAAATAGPQFAAVTAAMECRVQAPTTASLTGAGSPSVGSKQDQPGPLASLMADWGKSGSPWDLDGNGTVGVTDMLALLGKMGGGQAPQTLPAPAPPTPPPQDQSAAKSLVGSATDQADPLKALLADWGTSGSAWDLDGDGTVGVRDMLALLGKMNNGAQAPQTLPAPPPGLEPAPKTATESLKDTSDPMKALQADWGKSGSPWDLNDDGTVNVQDMLALLERMSTQKPGAADISAAAKPEAAPVTDSDAVPAPPATKLDSLLADWAKTGSQWDLDHDGTVNVRDLLALLSQMSDRGASIAGKQDPRLLNPTMMQKFRAMYGQAQLATRVAIGRTMSVVG